MQHLQERKSNISKILKKINVQNKKLILLKEQERQHKIRSTTYGTTGVIPDSNWHGLSIVVHCDRSVLTSDEMIRRQRRMQCCGNAAHPTLSTTKGGTGGRKGRRKEAKKKKYELSHYLNKKKITSKRRNIFHKNTKEKKREEKLRSSRTWLHTLVDKVSSQI